MNHIWGEISWRSIIIFHFHEKSLNTFSKRYSLKISFKLGYPKNKDAPSEKEFRLKTTPNNKKLFPCHWGLDKWPEAGNKMYSKKYRYAEYIHYSSISSVKVYIF